MSPRVSLPIISPSEDPFVLAILASPEDEAPRLIYADWLEERGDRRGEFLRLDCRLAVLPQDAPELDALVDRYRELHLQIDPRWRTAVSRSRIEKCPQFVFRCPKRWDGLRLTGHDRVRFCTACRKEVYYADDLRQAREHAEMGRCVAVDPAVPRWEGDLDPRHEMVLGMLNFESDSEPESEPRYPEPPAARREERRWWRFWT
ncbi:MAG TPA: TIGR02996 domain-containing protein [Gemmataceae bacterium]|nr:TIGR02996 domain-containing protein [Gemmataceae bacterium]